MAEIFSGKFSRRQVLRGGLYGLAALAGAKLASVAPVVQGSIEGQTVPPTPMPEAPILTEPATPEVPVYLQELIDYNNHPMVYSLGLDLPSNEDDPNGLPTLNGILTMAAPADPATPNTVCVQGSLLNEQRNLSSFEVAGPGLELDTPYASVAKSDGYIYYTDIDIGDDLGSKRSRVLRSPLDDNTKSEYVDSIPSCHWEGRHFFYRVPVGNGVTYEKMFVAGEMGMGIYDPQADNYTAIIDNNKLVDNRILHTNNFGFGTFFGPRNGAIQEVYSQLRDIETLKIYLTAMKIDMNNGQITNLKEREVYGTMWHPVFQQDRGLITWNWLDYFIAANSETLENEQLVRRDDIFARLGETGVTILYTYETTDGKNISMINVRDSSETSFFAVVSGPKAEQLIPPPETITPENGFTLTRLDQAVYGTSAIRAARLPDGSEGIIHHGPGGIKFTNVTGETIYTLPLNAGIGQNPLPPPSNNSNIVAVPIVQAGRK